MYYVDLQHSLFAEILVNVNYSSNMEHLKHSRVTEKINVLQEINTELFLHFFEFGFEQDRQCTYNVTFGRIHAIFVIFSDGLKSPILFHSKITFFFNGDLVSPATIDLT
jgi:hypothetical protein